MLITEPINNKRVLKTISFRADEKVVNEFKILCKEYGIKQVLIIENAMKKAIEEIKEMENNNDSN